MKYIVLIIVFSAITFISFVGFWAIDQKIALKELRSTWGWKITSYSDDGNVIREIKTDCNRVRMREGVVNIFKVPYDVDNLDDEYYVDGNYVVEKYIIDEEIK